MDLINTGEYMAWANAEIKGEITEIGTGFHQ